MDMSPGGRGRLVVSLGLLSVMAALAWLTMDAGRYRALTLVLLAFFAFRVVLARLGSR